MIAGTENQVPSPGLPPWCDLCEARPADDDGVLCRPCRSIVLDLDGLGDAVTGCPQLGASS